MKNTIFLFIFAFLFSFTVNAQSTVDSIAAKYQLLPMPEPLTIEKIFPVLGTYQMSTETEPAEVLVTLDTLSKGVVWIEGLPQGKIKAFLKQSPATYRIIAQKTSTGKQIPEGTLVLDEETNTLQIALGKSFNDADPRGVFASLNSTDQSKASSKSKSKITYITAVKTPVVKEEDTEKQEVVTEDTSSL